jgi:hypothetical protein
MVIDRMDLGNSMATLGIGSPAFVGFDDEAFACAKLLINFQRLSPSARLAWTQIQAQRGHATSFPMAQRPFFYKQMLNLKLQAFGPSLNGAANCEPKYLIDYPWSLTDGQFQTCMLYILTDQIPEADKLTPQKLTANEKIVVDVIKEKLKDELIEAAKALFGAAVGGAVAGGPIGLPVGFLAGLGEAIAAKLMEETIKQDLIRRYIIDESRRMYLASKGMSSYVRVPR